MDTVQLKVEWSLKAAKKLTSCACCMSGQGDINTCTRKGTCTCRDRGTCRGKGRVV